MSQSSQTPKRKPGLLGQRLVTLGLLDPTELRRMLALQSRLPPDEPVRRLGSLLVQSGRLSMRQLADALGAQRQVLPSSGVLSQVPPPLRHIFPAKLLHEIGAAPVCLSGQTLVVAMVDPHDALQIGRLRAETSFVVRPMQAPQLQVHRLLRSIPPDSSATLYTGPPDFGDLPIVAPAAAAPASRRSGRQSPSATPLAAILIALAMVLGGATALGVKAKLRRSARAVEQRSAEPSETSPNLDITAKKFDPPLEVPR